MTYILLLAGTCILITSLVVPWGGITFIFRRWKRGYIYYSAGLYVLLSLFVAMSSWTEIRFSSALTDILMVAPKDFTYLFVKWEKYVIHYFQYIQNPPLTFIFGYLYVIVWPSMVISSMFIYSYYRDIGSVKFLAKG